jgi:hypothetical protein
VLTGSGGEPEPEAGILYQGARHVAGAVPLRRRAQYAGTAAGQPTLFNSYVTFLSRYIRRGCKT